MRVEEPDLKALANKYPHLFLTEEELGERYASDPVRTKLRSTIEDQRAKINVYKDRIRAFQIEHDTYQADITRLKTELMAKIKDLDTKRRIARGNIKGTEHLIIRANRTIKKAALRYGMRNIQLFKIVVNRRLAAEGKTLRLARGRRAAQGKPDAIVDIELPPEPQPNDVNDAQKA